MNQKWKLISEKRNLIVHFTQNFSKSVTWNTFNSYALDNMCLESNKIDYYNNNDTIILLYLEYLHSLKRIYNLQ